MLVLVLDITLTFKNVRVPSNVKKYVSIEFITKKNKKKTVLYDAYVSGRFCPFGDLYHLTLTSVQLGMVVFQLGIPEYHNLDNSAMKLTRIRPYLLLSVAILDLC